MTQQEKTLCDKMKAKIIANAKAKKGVKASVENKPIQPEQPKKKTFSLFKK